MRTRVYVDAPEPNIRSMERIISNLKRYAPPDVEFVSDASQAHLVLIHANGRFDRAERQAQGAQLLGQQYAIIQYCLRSTMKPETHHWRDLWNNAKLVWSYYDLNGCIREDSGYGILKNLYCSPLGADSTVFLTNPASSNLNRSFMLGMSGGGPMVESVREGAKATERCGQKMFHLGPLHYMSHIYTAENVSDIELAMLYRQCYYFAGLRRKEGFEMCCAEAVLCGARPIFFDRIHYRQWFNDLAVFIPEGSRDDVIESLVKIFQQPITLVSPDEQEIARTRFHWPTICTEFWRRVL